MSKPEHEDAQQTVDDAQLVDLVAAVLVDPNVHTDLRMRLAHEITALLRDTREKLYGSAGRELREWACATQGDRLPDLLQAVLVDPNLHTDLRMRLRREIAEMVHAARERVAGQAEQPN